MYLDQFRNIYRLYYFTPEDYTRLGIKRWKRQVVLKPCPICGAEPYLYKAETGSPGNIRYVAIKCTGCGLETSRFWERKQSICLAVSDAVEHWNTRAGERAECCHTCYMICSGKTKEDAMFNRCDKFTPESVCINCKHYSSMRCKKKKKHINDPEFCYCSTVKGGEFFEYKLQKESRNA